MAENRIRSSRQQGVNIRIVHMSSDEVSPGDAAGVLDRTQIPDNEIRNDEFSLDQHQLAQVAADSARYISNWHELISQTNWEKGRIICQWRNKVCELHPEIKVVSDRAWSELTGGVSSEHVGRLRRTFERFGDVHENYDGLSWTHFMVAGPWSDAEMWLEGATQNGWTIDQMRRTRWEAMGAIAGDKPDPKDIIAEENSLDYAVDARAEKPIQQDGDVITGPIIDGPDWGDEGSTSSNLDSPDLEMIEKILNKAPDEFADAIRNLSELIKGCHADDWKSIKRRDVLKLLNFLKDQVRNESTPF